MMKRRRAEILVPIVDDTYTYRAHAKALGEIVEATDLAGVLRHIAENLSTVFATEWTITRQVRQ